MKRDLERLSRTHYDLLVVGGGIHGACVAWDAALRGLSVALVEQGDFGHATSANSQKIVHGGLRYLQSMDLARLRESVHERRTLLRIAPHLVHPLPCLMPTYGNGLRSRAAMSIAFLINDLLSSRRNDGIIDPARQIPRCRVISREECLQLAPGISEQGLTGGALWHDAQMYSPERLTLTLVMSAAERGADVANYIKATGFLGDDNEITGIAAEDLLTAESITIRARLVINASGPWIYRVLEPLQRRVASRTTHFVKAVAFVTRRLPNRVALALESRAEPSRTEGLLFITPWQDRSLIGCIYGAYAGDPEGCRATEDEIHQMLHEVNLAYPEARLAYEDVYLVHAGLLPAGPSGAPAVERHSRILDHKRADGVDGLISVIGVKYTTARGVAEKAVDLAMTKLQRALVSSTSHQSPIYGGGIERFGELVERVLGARPLGLSEAVLRHLLHSYGAAYSEVLEWVKGDATLAEPIEGSTEVIKAEVVHGIRQEMAMTLGDVVFRRTGLGSAGHPGGASLKSCAAVMARECGWNHQRALKEVAEVETRFPGHQDAALVVA
jgi:glycerol-3-phosphate dehydrogenase